jgi:transitional endoplasmic reticulum ATPase
MTSDASCSLTAVGPQLAHMRRASLFGNGEMSFEIAVQAMRRIQGSKRRLPEKIKAFQLPALNRNRSLA